MAEYTHNQTCEPTSADAQSIITIAKTHDEAESGLTAAFNQNATEQTADDYSSSHAESLFTIAKTSDKTDTSLTSAFNTEFVSQIAFDILLEFGLAADIGSFDAGGIPIIFYERTSPEPIIFYERATPEPIIFYARGETQRFIDQGTENKLTSPFNFTYEQGVPVIRSSVAEALIAMSKTNDKTDTSLTAAFSTAVA